MITVEKGFRCNAEMGNSRLDQDLLVNVVGMVAGARLHERVSDVCRISLFGPRPS